MKIETPTIKLDSFLKAVDAVSSGGEAKLLIQNGEVQVNGAVVRERGKKLRPGDRVRLGDAEFQVE